jgi:adenosylcobinamide-GDP ribazoletransferase
MSTSLLQFAARELRLVGVAMQFLTRVPVPMRRFDPDWLHASARHFPLVGALIGAGAGAVLWGAAALWSAGIAALLSMAATAWLTGAFHEDGMADTCDGLGGASTRDRALAIMKDSRLGSYGVVGLGLTLALKAAALTALLHASLQLAVAAGVLAHALSRACAVGVLAALPYAGDVEHAKAKPLAWGGGASAPVIATGWAVGVALAAGSLASGHVTPLRWWAAILCAVGVAVACARWLRRRLGGYTGDTLGAVQQWSELAVYLALAAQAAHG